MVRIKWRGIDKMLNTLGNAPGRTKQLTNAIVKNNTEKFMSRAKQHAPVDTFFLKDNIYTAYAFNGKTTWGQIHSPAGYSGYQEYGTRFQPGTPFFKPAMDATLPEFEKDFNDVMKGVFK